MGVDFHIQLNELGVCLLIGSLLLGGLCAAILSRR